MTSGVVNALDRDRGMCWDEDGRDGWSCEAAWAYEGQAPRVRAVWSPDEQPLLEGSESEFVQSDDVAVEVTGS